MEIPDKVASAVHDSRVAEYHRREQCSALSTSHFWHRRNFDNPTERIRIDGLARVVADSGISDAMLWRKAYRMRIRRLDSLCAMYVRAIIKRKRD